MQSTDSKERKSGACRRSDAHSEVQYDPSQNDTTTTRPAECVVVLPFAVIRKYWFQNANRLPASILAYLTVCFPCFAAAVGYGAEPATMATLRWNGDGEFMSWRWEKLGEAFEDGAARFAAESRIVSPTWAELDVLSAEVALKCLTNAPSRFLQMSFLRDGKVVSGPIRFEAVSVADKRETQTLAVSRAKHANGIVLSLSSGEVGDWGVYEMRLTTAPTTFVPPNEPPPKKQTGFMIIIK